MDIISNSAKHVKHHPDAMSTAPAAQVSEASA